MFQSGKVSKAEKEINEWLENNQDVKILFITQAGPSSTALITSIFYEKKE